MSGHLITAVLTIVNAVSFVDRDMVMRYFGGGIGHLKNAPPQQVPGLGFDRNDSRSEEMAVEGDGDDVVVNSELVQPEVSEDEGNDDDEEDEEDSDSDEGGDLTDEDEEGEDYGYA